MSANRGLAKKRLTTVIKTVICKILSLAIFFKTVIKGPPYVLQSPKNPMYHFEPF